jgi:ureidoglycolate dehydrogenase (NAD+)
MTSKSIPHDILEQWAKNALIAAGAVEEHAAQVASSLVQTSLWGIHSHGIGRLPHYVRRLQNGTINGTPRLLFQKTAAATGNLDGDHGLGIVVSHCAMDHAIALAREAGIGIVGIRHSTHAGALGLYTRQACKAGQIGIAFTHSDALVLPHNGTHAFFGTNPLSIAIPSDTPDRPLCVDMATSIVPWNRVMNARRDGRELPPDWAVDANGNATRNPEEAAAVRPMAGHKGYALAFLIDMLCGPLNGMPFGPHIPSMYEAMGERRMLGSLVIAIDPLRFTGGSTLQRTITQAIEEVHAQGDAVLFPGEPEYQSEILLRTQGLPIEPAFEQECISLSDSLGIARPRYDQ